MSNKEYNESSISVLSDVEHIKTRPGMYIGDLDNPRQLFSEAFDNAIDEVQSGFSEKVRIDIDTSTNEYKIRDYGRGIPHGVKQLDDGKEVRIIELLCTKSFSGGKFNNNSYVLKSGLNGVGLVCINALSESMSIISFRDKWKEYIISVDSVTKDCSRVKNKDSEPNGTLIKFIPNKDIFESSNIPLDYIVNRCKVASAFGMKTELFVDGKQVNTDGSIYDLIQEDSDISLYDRFNSVVKDKNTGEYVKFSISYTNDTGCKTKGFTNLIPNTNGGTHIWMMNQAIEDAWSRFKVPNVLYKDFYLGLRFVSAVFISETSFSSQTKEKLTVSKDYLRKFIKPISDEIYKWLCDNEETRKGLIKRFQEYRESQNKLLSKKELRNLIVVNNDTSGSVRRKSVVSKLVECSSRKREDTELYICEGDSASGSLVQARDVKTQAIIPLRGKILNASRLIGDVVRCMKNEEICSIANAAGTGILDECDHKKSRYERYIICADADPDGLQISSLVMSVFINILPDIVKAGMLYISVPPLYGWWEGKEYKFTSNQNEIPKNAQYKRYKGLGEMEPEEMYYTAMNKDTRKMIQVQFPEDLERFNQILTSASMKYDILYDLGLIKYV